MGVDLTLLPFYSEGMSHDDALMYFSHTVLIMQRRSRLWKETEAIERQFGAIVPDGFISYLTAIVTGKRQ